MNAILKPDTLFFGQQYDEYGNVQTVVAKVGEVDILEGKPLDIIDNTLLYFGSSLRGAKEGAKAILNNASCPPLLLSKDLDLVLVPSEGYQSETCIWFILKYIVYCDQDASGNGIVVLSDGSRVQINGRREKMLKKIALATKLRDFVHNRHLQFHEPINNPKPYEGKINSNRFALHYE